MIISKNCIYIISKYIEVKKYSEACRSSEVDSSFPRRVGANLSLGQNMHESEDSWTEREDASKLLV